MKKFLKRLALASGVFGAVWLAAYLAAPFISVAPDTVSPIRPPQVQTQTQTRPQNTFDFARTCMPRRAWTFNGETQYTCAFEAFKAFHIDLVDQTKMNEFVKTWDPKNFAGSDKFATPESTYKLIRQMRDALRNREFPDHNVFDYINSPKQSEAQQTQVARPVVQGGIGAMVKLNNDWEIRQNVTNSRADPKAPFKDAEEFIAFQKKLEESMVIGDGHELMVEAPIKNSPSWGKLEDGDFIIAINNQSLNGKTLNQAVSLLRGTPGSTITIQVKRKGVTDTLNVQLVRAVFEPRAVTVHDVNNIRHIILQDFTNENLLQDFYDALNGAKQKHMKGVNISVRGNPGGRVDYVVAMLEMVVTRGQILTEHQRVQGEVALKAREMVLNEDYLFMTDKLVGAPAPTADPTIEAREDYTPNYGKIVINRPDYVYAHPLKAVIDADMPVTVEVNGDSYSASEIFAGAIQFTRRGTIIGQPSPGKGVVMIQLPMPDRGDITVTSGRYFPGGIDTENVGILPDQTIEQPADFGKTDAIRDAAAVEIERLYADLVRRKNLTPERVKINLEHFNKTLDGRDDADKAPDHDSGH